MSAKFFCLFNSVSTESHNVEDRLKLLDKGCQKLGIEFVVLDQAKSDFSRLPVPTENDGLYNCARGSYLLEYALLNPRVKTFYRSYNPNSIKDDNGMLQAALTIQNISTPKTIFCGTSDRKLLKDYANYLGGFPLILKTYGKSGGLGVMSVDSLSSLYSLADYLVAEDVAFQLKEWIEADSVERVTVLGNRVLYTISRAVGLEDFRTDYFKNHNELISLDKESEQLAIQAAHACNYNFAGVDLIRRKSDGKTFILEVNFPQNFAPHEIDFKTNCAEEMLRWLFLQTKVQ
ncbi:ATP-grasp domain-containing protein [Roseivirga sp.]|uniref:ATP-grasp domain-containing protein n=1 Tax=Roseivirga sp. TaxID=1964215 RepID=UPI003B51D8D7